MDGPTGIAQILAMHVDASRLGQKLSVLSVDTCKFIITQRDFHLTRPIAFLGITQGLHRAAEVPLNWIYSYLLSQKWLGYVAGCSLFHWEKAPHPTVFSHGRLTCTWEIGEIRLRSGENLGKLEVSENSTEVKKEMKCSWAIQLSRIGLEQHYFCEMYDRLVFPNACLFQKSIL